MPVFTVRCILSDGSHLFLRPRPDGSARCNITHRIGRMKVRVQFDLDAVGVEKVLASTAIGGK